MKKFFEFNESYLNSNFVPLYHITNDYYLSKILKDDKITRGWFENPYKDLKIKMVSLTRNPKMELNFKEDSNVIIELDKNKMINKGYKFLPYDFFIHSKKENMPKSSIIRKEIFEFEECSFRDIENVSDFMISVNFTSDSSFYDPSIINCVKDLKLKNIKVLKNGIEL